MDADWRKELDEDMEALDRDLDALAGRNEDDGEDDESEDGEDSEGRSLDDVPPALLGGVVVGIGGYYLDYFGPVGFLVIVLLGAFAPEIGEHAPDAWAWLKRQFTPMSKRGGKE